MPVNSKFKCDLKISQWHLSEKQIVYFTGLDIQNLPINAIVKPKPTERGLVQSDWKLCPVVTTGNRVIIDDSMFLESERVFVNLLYAYK